MLSQLVFWHWFALAAFLGIVDVILGANFLFIWCGLVAVLVGILKWIIPLMRWEYQLLLFGLGVLASLLAWRQYLSQACQTQTSLNRRMQQYIGQQFLLKEPISNGRGKIKIGDTLWQVQGDAMPKGTAVVVTGVAGIAFTVEKVEKSQFEK